MKRRILAIVAALAAVGGAVVASHVQDAQAADHLDPNPRVTLGDAGDIGDLYAWHADNRMTTVLTFAGPVAPDSDAAFDRDVLYAIHVDGPDEDTEADHSLWFRFGQKDGAWGVWAEGLPGSDADVVGPVGESISSGTAQLFAGQKDDPFFFDLQGFQDTLATGGLSFDPDRDFFAGQNINAIVAEFPVEALGFDGPYHIWATTAQGAE